jgi:putative SOS response-associated peptidase YedK
MDFAHSYNIATQTIEPVVRLGPDTGERELAIMRWGLVPYWSRTAKMPYSTINADASKLTTIVFGGSRSSIVAVLCLPTGSTSCR